MIATFDVPRQAGRWRASALMLSILWLAPTVFRCGMAHGETAAEAARRPVQGPVPHRLADGHLNWTGFWDPKIGLLENNIGLGGEPAGPAGAGTGKPVEGLAASGQGTAPPRPSIPFVHFSTVKEPYKSQLDTFMRGLQTGKVSDPVAQCFPPGMPRMMSMVYGMELLQTSDQIAITSEWQAASRRIWLTQKTHTPADELDPTYTGESIGHWEGDTLVVDTVGIRKDVPLNFTGLYHSDNLHLVERFTETKPGILVDEVTVDDPDAFVAPWKEIETYRYRPDLRIEEYVCLENNRNVGEHGEAVFSK